MAPTTISPRRTTLLLPSGAKVLVSPAPPLKPCGSGVPPGLTEAAGELNPVIDKVFSFSELPQAHAKVDSGRKRGSVVVRIPHSVD